MSRCCSKGGGTAIEAGSHITILGTGSPSDPFVISADAAVQVLDNQTFNMTLVGSGSAGDPWTITVDFASTAKLSHIPDVSAPSPSNAQVLGWDATIAKWRPFNPTTASAGTVTTDVSLAGDGSAPQPLQVRESAEGWLATKGDGLSFSDAAINATVRKFADDDARFAALPAPDLNTVSMLDSEPGMMHVFNGATWGPMRDFDYQINNVMLAMSGDYDGSSPISVIMAQVSATTDDLGQFDVLSSADLTGRAGVLYATYTETGSVPYKTMITEDFNRIVGVAYRLDDGTLLTGQEISGFVLAYTY